MILDIRLVRPGDAATYLQRAPVHFLSFFFADRIWIPPACIFVALCTLKICSDSANYLASYNDESCWPWLHHCKMAYKRSFLEPIWQTFKKISPLKECQIRSKKDLNFRLFLAAFHSSLLWKPIRVSGEPMSNGQPFSGRVIKIYYRLFLKTTKRWMVNY